MTSIYKYTDYVTGNLTFFLTWIVVISLTNVSELAKISHQIFYFISAAYVSQLLG